VVLALVSASGTLASLFVPQGPCRFSSRGTFPLFELLAAASAGVVNGVFGDAVGGDAAGAMDAVGEDEWVEGAAEEVEEAAMHDEDLLLAGAAEV
jgi:hypothetical protein